MLDILWILICAIFVLLMQAGFTCLETGLVRSKNSINVAIKNLMDICVSSAIFWLFGFGLMFGESYQGIIGHNQFIFQAQNSATETAIFFFQMMFCGTAITIVSGAVAERMSFIGYMLTSILIAALIYPVSGHWAWGGLLDNTTQGWLAQSGFIDFAGSTVVHSVGGWGALAAILIIGPRRNRFSGQGKIQGSNLSLSALGTLFLWIGWFGFNGGSTLSMSNHVPVILLNTFLAAIFSGLSATTYIWIKNKTFNVIYCISGILGGLVAVTAACHLLSPLASSIIAIIAGIIVCQGMNLLEKLKIDDAVGAVPVHLFAGAWGTLAWPFFVEETNFGTGLELEQQLMVQLLGVVAIGLYVFTISFVGLKLLNRFCSLRVSAQAENEGLNISEHQATTEIYNLLNSMLTQEKEGDFSQPVEVEPFTEVGQIAKQYNNVLNRVNNEIHDREIALDKFKKSESRKGAILNSALDCIVTIDLKGKIKEFNIASEKCFGLSNQRVINRSFIDLFVPASERNKFYLSLKSQFSISGNLALNRHNRFQLQRIHNQEFPAELSITLVELQSGLSKEFTFHIRDVTKQMIMHNKMQKMAYHDVLTNLYNRNFFKQKLKQEIDFSLRHRSSILLMFIDLDQFKAINDSLGHEAGDKLLCHVAKFLLESVREEDIVCRWGGDEFLIIFPDINDQQTATIKAEQILNALKNPLRFDGRELFAQCSIGIAFSHAGEITAEHLIQRADMAMYEAKQKGRNTFCFFLSEMEEKANDRFYYESELRTALKLNQFFLEYQPKVNCQTGYVSGFEALIRWLHPEIGIVPPYIFIPILEETGLINSVTQWVLNDVCNQLKVWREAGLENQPIAVNLSAKDFLLENFEAQVTQTLENYQIPGEMIELELTESILAKNTEQCIATMKRLKTLNIQFSVDDFGTGYSSMNYLKKFPLDTLKIDRAFIKECDINKEDGAICQAIIALGKNLGLKIVAEGVETDSQLDYLKQTECDIYQGYLFSRPLPSDEASNLLKTLAIN